MARVDVCPENLTTIIEASTRLGCDKDEYGNDQYICLPKVDLSSLVEFCYKGIMGYNEKGNCLQAFKGNLTLSPCVGFSSGCPKRSFKSSEFYKYSACQNLDLEHRCYKTDPKCPQNIDGKNSDTQAGLIGFMVAIPIVILFVLFVLVYIYLRKRRKRRKTKKIDGDCKETNNEDVEEMHNFPLDEHPDRPFLNRDSEVELKDISQHTEMNSDEPVDKCVKKNEKLSSSVDKLIEKTIKEMQTLFPGEEALIVAESAVLSVKKCIDIDAKTNDIFSNLIVISKLLTMLNNNPNLYIFELKATRCFLLNVFNTPQFSFEHIKKIEECRKHLNLSDDKDYWSRAAGLEDSLKQRNRELTNIGKKATRHEKDILEKNSCEEKVVEYLGQLKSEISDLIRVSEAVSARRATAYVNLYFRIAILHSFVLWQSFWIKRRSSYDQYSTKFVFSEIKRCQNSYLDMLRYITEPQVESAVFSSVCHITDNENVRNFLHIHDITPFLFDENFYIRKHYIQWGKSLELKLQMRSYRYGLFCTNSVNGKCEFTFVSVNGREVDNICYIKSAHWEDYYMRMSENGSCDAVKNIPEQGGEWKFVPLDIKQEHPMFIISSVDWPENFLYLESEGRSVKGESDLKKIKENGQWRICDVKREHETPGLN